MSKFILVLKGSPRENGNSNVLAEQVIVGAKEAGAEVESFMLHHMDIRPCDACDVCQETGMCIIKDDMQTLYPLLVKADAIVIASPIYWFTLSAQTKLCIDRWYALESPQGSALRSKQIGIVLTYGDTDLYTSGGINAIHTFESISRYIGAEIKGMVYGCANKIGDAEKQPALMDKAYQLGQKLGTNA
ncbi:MAG: flavodoxin family protein [Anaerolineales bacterium]|nr:flavodoxin family protein [Anaerolineales bacterium]